MAEPFLSEIRVFSFNFPPKGWAFCNGQTLPINQNQALFALLGTTYGGDGRTTFQLPNLQGRVPIHQGSGFVLGEAGGEAFHTLNVNEMPQHAHTTTASNSAATANAPLPGNALAQPATSVGSIYGPAGHAATLAPQALGNAGGGQPHTNLQPYLALNFCIALQGIFPSQS